MGCPKEVRVKLKGDDCTHTKEFLVYEDFEMSENSSLIRDLVKQARDEVTGSFDECQIIIKMEWV